MTGNSPRPPQPFCSKKLFFLAVAAALLLSHFGFQQASQEESIFGEYDYYSYRRAGHFNPDVPLTKYTSHAELILNTDSTYSYFSVQHGRKYSSDSGSFSKQGNILSFSSKFGNSFIRNKTYHTGVYSTSSAYEGNSVHEPEFIDLQACDTNCLTVFFYHNADSVLSCLEFALGSKERMVKLRGEFPPEKSYYFYYPKKVWKEEDPYALVVNIPELYFAQKDYPEEGDMFLQSLVDIKNGTVDTLNVPIIARDERKWPLHNNRGALPQHLHGIKMLWENEELYLRYLKGPEFKEWVWDRNNWLQKKRL